MDATQTRSIAQAHSNATEAYNRMYAVNRAIRWLPSVERKILRCAQNGETKATWRCWFGSWRNTDKMVATLKELSQILSARGYQCSVDGYCFAELEVKWKSF